MSVFSMSADALSAGGQVGEFVIGVGAVLDEHPVNAHQRSAHRLEQLHTKYNRFVLF